MADAIMNLGVIWDYEEGDVVTDVVVLAKVIDAEGESGFALSTSAGTDFITRVGLLHLAETEQRAILGREEP